MAIWNNTFETKPLGSDSPSQGDDQIRELKLAVRERMYKEHEFDLTSGASSEDGWHVAGSAKVYVGASAPTLRPGPLSVPLDADDDGRLWLSSTDFSLRAYRHAAGATAAERWEIVSGSGGSGENFVTNDLTKPNISGVTADSTGSTAISWDATATDLLNVGALEVVVGAVGTDRYIDIDLNDLDPNNVGQQWSIKLSYLLDTAADDLITGIYLYDGTSEIPTTLTSLPHAGGTLQTVSGAVYPTTVLTGCKLRIRFKDSTACTLYLADISVGPFNPYGGAAVGNWTSYTPSVIPTNCTGSWVGGRYRRNGSSLEFSAYFLHSGPITGTGVTWSIDTFLAELGLTRADSGLSFNCNFFKSGAGHSNGAWSGGTFYTYAGGNLSPSSPWTWASGDRMYILFSVPITQWTSNINLVQDFQEFAYNTDTSAAADTTSFGYGSAGALIPNITTSIAGIGVSKRVSFLQPIQNTDMIVLEFYDSSVGRWVQASERNGGIIQQGGYYYGARVSAFNGLNTLDVTFSGGGYRPSAASYAAASTNLWSSLYIVGWKWRVRKISNGNMAEVPIQVQVPVGTVSQFAGATAPTTYLICDGAAISRTAYSELFSVIGTGFGVGDGSTTFNIPDLRGAAPAGVGTSTGYTQNETIALGTKYNDQSQGHRHTFNFDTIAAVGTAVRAPVASTASSLSGAVRDPESDGTNGTPRIGTTTRGKLVGLNFIIKATRG